MPQAEGGALRSFYASRPCETVSFSLGSDDTHPGLLFIHGAVIIDELDTLQVPLPPAEQAYGDFFEEEFDFKTLRKTFTKAGTYFDVLMQWEEFATQPPPSSLASPEEEERRLQEFSATLCAGYMPRGLDEVYGSFLGWRAKIKWAKRLSRLDRRLAKGKLLPRRLYHPFMAYLGINGNEPDENGETFFPMIQVASSCRLGRTARGVNLCLVPQHARLGDRVVLCQGSNLPLILRGPNEDQHWELVGCGFIHGIMFGEAWKLGESQEIILL